MDAVEEPLPELDPEILRRRRERTALIAGGVVLIAVVAILGYRLLRPLPATDYVLLAAEEMVRSQVHPHGVLHFSPKELTTVTDLGDDGYRVQGWVEDVTDSGPAQRCFYSVNVQIRPPGTLMVSDPQISPEFLELPR